MNDRDRGFIILFLLLFSVGLFWLITLASDNAEIIKNQKIIIELMHKNEH